MDMRTRLTTTPTSRQGATHGTSTRCRSMVSKSTIDLSSISKIQTQTAGQCTSMTGALESQSLALYTVSATMTIQMVNHIPAFSTTQHTMDCSISEVQT